FIALGLAVAARAATPAAAPAPGSIQDQATSLWQLLVAGGWCMILQGFLSVGAIALVIYHLKNIKVEKLVPPDFCENLFVLLEKKEYEKALSVSRQQENLVSAIAVSVLPRISRGKMTPAQIEAAVQVEGKSHVEKLWQNLTYLGDIAVVAP